MLQGSVLGALMACGAVASSEKVPLEQAIVLWRQGWGELRVDTATQARGKKGRTLQIGEKRYDKGLGVHAPSTILVELGGRYAFFLAEVGVQSQPKKERGTVVFQVFVDGEKRFDSGRMEQDDAAKSVRVSLDGAMEMTLTVTDAGDGISFDCANWSEAFLVPGTSAAVPPNRPLLDVSPFAFVFGWDPAFQGAHPGRVQTLTEKDIFHGTELSVESDGSYQVPLYGDGTGCIGLQWFENRFLRELGLRFREGTDVPPVNAARVERWVGESAWQGDWQVLSGEIREEGSEWSFRIQAKDMGKAPAGVQKVRWILPDCRQGVHVSGLSAFPFGASEETALQIALGRPRPGVRALLEMYNGEIIPSEGEEILYRVSWDLGEKQLLRVRYLPSRPGFSKADRTSIRLNLPLGSCAVAVEDVVKEGAIWAPDFDLFVSSGEEFSSLEDYRKRYEERPTVLQRVRSMPDQSFRDAMHHVHREIQDKGPTMLSLACDNRKFIVGENGDVTFRVDPEMRPNQDRKSLVYSPKIPLKVDLSFGREACSRLTRTLHKGWMPVPVLAFREGSVQYRQTAFVAPGGSDNRPLFVGALAFENASNEEAKAVLRVSFQVDEEEGKERVLEKGEEDVRLRRGDHLLAFLRLPERAVPRVDAGKGEILLEVPLKAKEALQCALYIPGWLLSCAEASELRCASELLRETEAYWESLFEDTLQIQLPEKRLENLIRASQAHCLMAARSEQAGERVAAWAASDRYGPLESESHAVIFGMDLMGHREFAQKGLDFFLARYDENGRLTTGYTLMGFGWHLWTLADHVELWGDDVWLEAVLPSVRKGCAWIMDQRRMTQRTSPDGEKVLEHGLMPPGLAADWSRFTYQARPQAEFFAGLSGARRLHERLGHPDAEKIANEAEALGEEILRAYRWTQERSPLVELRDGSWIPYCPAIFGCFGRVGDLYPGEDGGRAWGKDMSMGAHNLVVLGVMDPKEDRQVEWIVNYLEDYWCLLPGMGSYSLAENERDWFHLGGFSKVQPYYTRLVELYAMMDAVKPFIRSYFNAIPSLISRENLTFWEHFHNQGAWNKTHETGWFLVQTRQMLVMERGEDLWLAPFVTNRWMRDGMAVEVDNAPTKFGKVSYKIRSAAASGRIEASVTAPRRSPPSGLVLRLRHPDGKPMRKVTVNGDSWQNFDPEKEIVRLDGREEKLMVVVAYERAEP